MKKIKPIGILIISLLMTLMLASCRQDMPKEPPVQAGSINAEFFNLIESSLSDKGSVKIEKSMIDAEYGKDGSIFLGLLKIYSAVDDKYLGYILNHGTYSTSSQVSLIFSMDYQGKKKTMILGEAEGDKQLEDRIESLIAEKIAEKSDLGKTRLEAELYLPASDRLYGAFLYQESEYENTTASFLGEVFSAEDGLMINENLFWTGEVNSSYSRYMNGRKEYPARKEKTGVVEKLKSFEAFSTFRSEKEEELGNLLTSISDNITGDVKNDKLKHFSFPVDEKDLGSFLQDTSGEKNLYIDFYSLDSSSYFYIARINEEDDNDVVIFSYDIGGRKGEDGYNDNLVFKKGSITAESLESYLKNGKEEGYNMIIGERGLVVLMKEQVLAHYSDNDNQGHLTFLPEYGRNRIAFQEKGLSPLPSAAISQIRGVLEKNF